MQSNKAKQVPHFNVQTVRSIYALVTQSSAGCWEWQGTRDAYGYGTVTVSLVPYRVHRVMYQMLVAELRESLVIDHLCGNTSCCNPQHLEQVTDKENTLRGESAAAQNARKTHCDFGHKFTRGNTYVDPRGWRQCRQCSRRRKAAARRESTHCKNGHERTPENTRYRKQGRTCRICQLASERRSAARKKESEMHDTPESAGA